MTMLRVAKERCSGVTWGFEYRVMCMVRVKVGGVCWHLQARVQLRLELGLERARVGLGLQVRVRVVVSSRARGRFHHDWTQMNLGQNK